MPKSAPGHDRPYGVPGTYRHLSFGLTETAVPIKLAERTIGYLRIGQVLRHMPAKSSTSKVDRELEDAASGLPVKFAELGRQIR